MTAAERKRVERAVREAFRDGVRLECEFRFGDYTAVRAIAERQGRRLARIHKWEVCDD